MKQIALISGNPGVLALCRQLLASEAFSDIELISCVGMHSPEVLLEAIINSGSEVVIARGTRASFIASRLPVTVVDLPVTPFDLLRALKKAKSYGNTVGLITSDRLLQASALLSPLLGITVHSCSTRGMKADTLVRQVMDAGAEVIVGGQSVFTEARDISCPKVLLGIDKEGILESIEESRRIAHAIAQQKQQTNLMQAFLEHSYSGVIAVDTQSTILMFNPFAQRLLQIPESKALGRTLDEICLPLSLKKAFNTGHTESGGITEFSQKTFIYDKVLVRVDSIVVGGLVIFQDVRQVQQAEASVRRKIFETGHIAEGTFGAILGTSPARQRAVEHAKEFAITDSTVLLLGETGTGKEIFAQSIHNYSKRNTGPFVAINCAALPAELLESELFGYEAGAFTGARVKGKPGMFELAHGGTLFLDEIGEMDIQLQGKFLRVLQERKLLRLGGDKMLPIDVRLVAATNKNLFECVTKGTFRQDLYYRLNVLKLHLPPLRECPEDIGTLARAFLKRHLGDNVTTRLTPKAIVALQEHPWPGNTRELLNFMERAAVLYGKQEKIDEKVIKTLIAEEQVLMPPIACSQPEDDDLAEIHRILAMTNGSYTKTAKILGLSRVTLWRKLKRNIPQGEAR